MPRPGGGVFNISSLLAVYHARDYNGVAEAVYLAQNDDTGSATVLVSDARTIPANLTIPANVALKIIPGGKITPASGVTLTINGPLDIGGAWQAFDLSAGGSVAFGPGIKISPEWFGADPTGATDSTAALQAAFTAAQAQAVGGCVELAPNATYKHNAALTLGSGVIELYGHGNSSVIQATAAMTAQILGTDTSFSTLRDFTLDGAGHACDGLHFKTSGGPGNDLTTSCRWSRIVTINHPSGNWPLYNQGHEDLTIDDCITRESVNGLYSHTPNGAIRVANCSIFGYWDIDYQSFSVDGCVTGPFLITPNNWSILNVTGSYCYDSATYNLVSGNGGNPSSAFFAGCYLVCQQALCNTGLGPNTILNWEDCSVIYTGPAGTYNIIDVGATGSNSKYVLRNVTCQPNAATTVNVASIAGGTFPWIELDPEIAGANSPGFVDFTPSVPGSGVVTYNQLAGRILLTVAGGTVTQIQVDGKTTGLTSGSFLIRPGHSYSITYSVAPTICYWQAE